MGLCEWEAVLEAGPVFLLRFDRGSTVVRLDRPRWYVVTVLVVTAPVVTALVVGMVLVVVMVTVVTVVVVGWPLLAAGGSVSADDVKRAASAISHF